MARLLVASSATHGPPVHRSTAVHLPPHSGNIAVPFAFAFTLSSVAGLLLFYLGAQAIPRAKPTADKTIEPASRAALDHTRAEGGAVFHLRAAGAWQPARSPLPVREGKIRHVAVRSTKPEFVEKNLIVQRGNGEGARYLLGQASVREGNTSQNRSSRSRAAGARSTGDAVHAKGRYSVRGAFISFDGPADWTIDDFERIERFYLRRFGRPPPVSAMGQSDTHERLGLDHRDAVDLAVRPDSPEGRALMAYLRAAGIPFIAFRGKFRGVSTGAHIHIGHPSPRLIEARQRAVPVRYDDADRG